jgi:XTP/dITP diphosphohydrolase
VSRSSRPFLLASSNVGKIREIERVLAPCGYRPLPQSERGLRSPPENGESFLENALLKARHAARACEGLPVLADDSGLEVEALDGRPGVRTSELAGVGADDAANVARLLELLAPYPEPERRGARFVCCLVWLPAAGHDPRIFTGVCPGRITLAPRGQNGFGYDPVFEIPELGRTLAEVAPAVKDALSHRGRALEALRNFLSDGANTALQGS